MQEIVVPKWVAYTFLVVIVALFGVPLWSSSHSLVLRLSAMVVERSGQKADAIITSRLTISTVTGHGERWDPAWKYSYAVNGFSYTGESPDIPYSYQAPWYPVKSIAEQASLVRSVGMRVRIYYDPHDPGRSVLDRPVLGMIDWLNVMLLLFIFAVARDVRRKGRKR